MLEKNLTKNSNNNRGFSLLETLLAISLFAFLAVGVLTMTSMGIKSSAYAQHHTKAVQLAEDSMEMMRRVDFNDPLQYFDGISEIAVDTPAGYTIHPVSDFGTIPRYPDFRRVLQVTGDPPLRTLQVTITWRSQGVTLAVPIVLTTQRRET